jgi:ubiquinone/menaquinone biosynthesis C-methylase UbiE/uncharacterized protein YbaR (Trm112 family)
MQQTIIDRYLCCPVDKSYPLVLQDAEVQGTEVKSGYLRCPSCGHCYPIVAGIPQMFPPSHVQATEAAEAKSAEAEVRNAEVMTYDAQWTDYPTKIEFEAMLKALNIRKGEVVVELGAGTGRLTTVLSRLGPTILALDIASRSLELNRSKCEKIPGADVHFIAADACFLPLRDSVGDKVASSQLLEHIPTEPERQRLAHEARRVLKQGGVLALTTYNFSWTKRRYGDREGFHNKRERTFYYFRYKREELRELFRAGGFEVKSVTGLLNLSKGQESPALDRLVAMIPPVAALTGHLLFIVARPHPLGARAGLHETTGERRWAVGSR